MSREALLAEFNAGKHTQETLVFTQGMQNWAAAKDVPELGLGGTGVPVPPPPVATPPDLDVRSAHEIDYEVLGEEMQFVEIELDPAESVVAEAGSMMYMTNGIQMETVFGDGSRKSENSGLMDKFLGAGKRLLTGESLFMTVFSNAGTGKQKVAFASPYPGKIIPVHLAEIGGTLICQKDSFLCAAKGVAVGIAFQKKIGVGLFGGEGFIMQKLEGDGWVFVHAGGTIVEKELGPGESLRVDTGCLVALHPSVSYDVQFVGNVKSAIFGGEGFFFAALKGPGKVWLQSLPFSRLAGRVHEAAPQTGSGSKGEGSIIGKLGGIGGFFDGD